jgi:hypothetical protein
MAEAAAALNSTPPGSSASCAPATMVTRTLLVSRYHLGRSQEELRGQEEAEKAAFVRMAEEFKIP